MNFVVMTPLQPAQSCLALLSKNAAAPFLSAFSLSVLQSGQASATFPPSAQQFSACLAVLIGSHGLRGQFGLSACALMVRAAAMAATRIPIFVFICFLRFGFRLVD